MYKKIIIILIIFLITFFNLCAQATNNDTILIEWNSGNKIRWTDFQSKIDTTSQFKAECTTVFKCIFYLENDSVFCKVKAFFNPKKSWKKSTNLDDGYDLNHEQLHFDITEIFARKIRQLIIINNLNEETIQKVYNESAKACNDFQETYDKETNHAMNKINQHNWTEKINALLSALDQYKEQSIYIKNPFCKIYWE